MPDSTWKWYYSNGKIKREEFFYDGLSDGLMTEYNFEGKIISQGDYIEGKKEGSWFYDAGDNRDEGEYIEGMRNGMWQSIDREGFTIYKGKFVDDLPNGKHIWYWDNGKVKQEGTYVMGRKNGDWKKYDKEGFLIISISYQAGKEIKYDGISIDTEN